MTKLTIAQFTFGLQLAGQERVVVDLANAFHQMGHRSLVCTTLFGGELTHELEVADISFQCLALERSYDPRALIPLMRYLKDNRVDVVITHGNSGSSMPRIAAILSRVSAFIHVEHNISDHKTSFHILFNRLITLLTDKVVCVSENARKSLLRIEKTPANKVVVIHNGINTERFKKCQVRTKKNSLTRKVGIVGRFYEQKGHIYFVEAASDIIRSIKNIEFIFIGDGPLKSFIEEKVKSCGLSSYCRFLGERKDVPELLQTLDVFVLASLWEGLPISLLEAQYFGVPVVVTDVGGIREVIDDGHNGMLVPPRNSQALARAVTSLLNDNILQEKLSCCGQKFFFNRFTVDKMARTYIDLATDIIKKKKGLR